MSASVNRNLGESPARLLLHTDDVDMVCVIHLEVALRFHSVVRLLAQVLGQKSLLPSYFI
jgi:hypothetical protein